jgi:hypothetical protein
MSWTDDDHAINPLQRVAIFAIVVVGGILFIITRFYHGPPVPSPFGCYEGLNTPKVRLTPSQLAVNVSPLFRQRTATEESKNGYIVQPGFRFIRNRSGSLAPMESDLLVLIEAKPRHSPSMQVALDGNDNVILQKVPCGM